MVSRNGSSPAAWFFASLVASLVAGVSLGIASPVLAQEGAPADPEAAATEAGSHTEEILVMARRREENQQKTPVSVTALSQSMLDERSATRLTDLAGLAPSLTIQAGSFGVDSADAAIFLRGVGQGDSAVFSDPGVGIYLDGIYLARAQGALLDLVELERVEVLRGPQGTLFGKNTTGGAIQLVTRRPAREFQARLALSAGTRDTFSGQASVDFRLGEHLFGSVAVRNAENGPFSRSLADGEEFGDQQRRLARGSLEYAPESGLQVYLSADYLQEEGSGNNQAMVALEQTPLLVFYNQVLADQGFTPYSEAFLVTDPTTSFSSLTAGGQPFVDGKTRGISLDISRLSGKFLWRSLSGYREVDYAAAGDADGSPVQASEVYFRERQSQLSEEIQVQGQGTRADWLLGAIYFEEKPREDNTQFVLGGLYEALELAPGAIYAPPGVPSVLCRLPSPPAGLPCFGGRGNPFNLAFFLGDGLQTELDLENRSWALFGESSVRVSENLSLTFGARYSEDRKRFSYLTRNGFGSVSDDLENADRWNDWSGRISLAWQWRPEVLLYANLARGFKSGGFNGRPQSRGVLDPFDPEIVVSGELGFKTDLLDRRLRLNGVVFTSEYRDIHFGASLQGASGEPVFVTQNAGDAEIRGLELELELHPAEQWVLAGSTSLLDTELVEVDPRVPSGIDIGNELPQAPAWSYSLSLQRTVVLAASSALIARADWTHSAGFFQDVANVDSIRQKSLGLLAARLSYGPYSGRFEVSLFGRNLTDERYFGSGFVAGAFGPSLVTPGRPREWGGEVVLRF